MSTHITAQLRLSKQADSSAAEACRPGQQQQQQQLSRTNSSKSQATSPGPGEGSAPQVLTVHSSLR